MSVLKSVMSGVLIFDVQFRKIDLNSESNVLFEMHSFLVKIMQQNTAISYYELHVNLNMS